LVIDASIDEASTDLEILEAKDEQRLSDTAIRASEAHASPVEPSLGPLELG
jgi:hypothetical protein